MVWQALISPVADLIGGYLNNKREQSQAAHERRLQVIQNDADWETKMAIASGSSWKDEFWTLVLAVPLFCLGYADRVRDSFVALDTLPDWYQYLLFLAVSASFGIRGANKLMKLKKQQ